MKATQNQDPSVVESLKIGPKGIRIEKTKGFSVDKRTSVLNPPTDSPVKAKLEEVKLKQMSNYPEGT